MAEPSLAIDLDPEVKAEIAAELGSVNKFYDRLATYVSSETNGEAQVVPMSEISLAGEQSRGGAIAIIVEAAAFIHAVAPIVIAWIRSRGYDVEEKTETKKNGTTLHTIRVHRGAGR
jgi:hypothetical protein